MKLLKNLVLLSIFSIFSSYSQNIDCEKLLDTIKYDGRRLDNSCPASTAIYCINWYAYKEVLFAVVRFKSYGKEYVYGGWEYKFDSYWDLKKAFDGADSHGSFFLENIKPATINCSS